MMLKSNDIRTVEPFRHNRKLYGAFVTFRDSGRMIYVAYRSNHEIFRAGREHKTLSAAIRAGTAAWALDISTLGTVRSRGVDWVCILVRRTHDKWLARIADFYDPYKTVSVNYSKRGGANQRYLSLQHFWHIPGRIDL